MLAAISLLFEGIREQVDEIGYKHFRDKSYPDCSKDKKYQK